MGNKSVNRWSVVFGAVLLQLCLGAIYSWSLFNQPLMDKFGWSSSEVVMTFSIAIFCFAASTLISGRLQDRIGPKKVAMIGGLLYGGGLLLASQAESLGMLYFAYGVLAGAGVGFAYVCPLATCVKWFPEKKGLINGIAVGAFGLGALVFKSVIVYLLETVGVSDAFLYLGLIYAVLVLIGAQFLRVPEAKPAGSQVTAAIEMKPGEMIRTSAFRLLWPIYLFGCISGLLVIGLAKDIGIELAGLEPAVAAEAVGVIALFNAGGRLAWGVLSDKFGRLRMLLAMCVLTASSMLVLAFVPMSFVVFFAALAAVSFCFGGFLALFPTIIGEFFGTRNLGGNYGIVYQAYGVAALAGPFIIAAVGDLHSTFMIAGALAIIGAVLTLKVRVPEAPEPSLRVEQATA